MSQRAVVVNALAMLAALGSSGFVATDVMLFAVVVGYSADGDSDDQCEFVIDSCDVEDPQLPDPPGFGTQPFGTSAFGGGDPKTAAA